MGHRQALAEALSYGESGLCIDTRLWLPVTRPRSSDRRQGLIDITLCYIDIAAPYGPIVEQGNLIAVDQTPAYTVLLAMRDLPTDSL